MLIPSRGQRSQIYGCGRGVQGPACGEGDARLARDVAVRYVADDFFAVVLEECDVDDSGLSTELDIFDDEGCGPDLCASQELEVQREGVRLVLAGEGRVEVGGCYTLEDGGDEAAVRDYEG